MIATKVDTIYEVELPSSVKALLAFFESIVSLGVPFLDMPLNCLGAGGGTERAHELDARSLRGLLGVVLHPRLGSVWERGTGLARYRATRL